MLISEENFNLLYNLFYGGVFFTVLLSTLSVDVKGQWLIFNIFLRKFVLFVSLVFIILIGFRDYNVGADTSSYYYYNWILEIPSPFQTEIIFDWLIKFTKYLGLSFTVFLIFVALFFYINIIKSLFKIGYFFKVNVFFLFFIFLSLFFFKSMSINIIRQGLSLSFLLLGYSLWLNKKPFKIYLLPLVLSIITHFTSLVPLSIFVMSFFIGSKIKTRYLYILYIFTTVLAYFKFGISDIMPFLKGTLEANGRASYLTGTSELYTIGFKPQFVAFNSVFLIISYYVQNKVLKKDSLIYVNYKIISMYFIFSSIIFFVMFQIPYSDRFGLFSWLVIPILVAPLLTYEKSIVKYKTPVVLFFSLIYLFFAIYESSK